ncbi:NADP-dependent oxidoreductase [Rosenbergiella collisarenosi]|uniref:NADP-dependent oxidoreductase n=1 Tax=Rosenbergiella collisarenosi TaxID=1544695 RepID=UPI001F4F1C3B|nr:NADP-dependent oxidoreductase [Rosenbergiella collisarenosi]
MRYPEINTHVILAKHPNGKVEVSDFKVEEVALRPLEIGEFLIANQYISIDPYVRPRLNMNTEYVNPIKVGDVISCEATGTVIASRNAHYALGDRVYAYSGWKKYHIGSDKDFLIRKLPTTSLPESVFLNSAGTSGRSAYFGIHRIAHPKPGETMVVSAAAGPVGSIAGQIGKIEECRVVGIAGTTEKCRYVVEVLGFDECINYKDSDFREQLRKACPQGIDIYFENVGGPLSVVVARYLNEGARVPICGSVAHYDSNSTASVSGPAEFFSSLPDAPTNRFFLVTEWFKDYAESDSWLINALEQGKLKHKETITQGLDAAPRVFVELMNSRHFGKQLIEII